MNPEVIYSYKIISTFSTAGGAVLAKYSYLSDGRAVCTRGRLPCISEPGKCKRELMHNYYGNIPFYF